MFVSHYINSGPVVLGHASGGERLERPGVLALLCQPCRTLSIFLLQAVLLLGWGFLTRFGWSLGDAHGFIPELLVLPTAPPTESLLDNSRLGVSISLSWEPASWQYGPGEDVEEDPQCHGLGGLRHPVVKVSEDPGPLSPGCLGNMGECWDVGAVCLL